MGIAMSKNLQDHTEKPILVYNRSIERSQILKAESPKVVILEDPTQLAKESDIIFICVANDEVLNSIFDKIIGEVRGKIIVEMSTVHPDTTRELAKKTSEAGGEFVACPVFGAPAMAVAAKLVMTVAGKQSSIDKVTRYFDGVMGRATVILGEDPGLASLMKITGNTFIISMIETIAEGLTFAEVSGLGTDNCMKFVSTLFGGTPWEAYAHRMVSGQYAPSAGERPGFAVDLASKDARHALNLSRKGNYEMTILSHAAENFKKVSENPVFEGRGDISSVYGPERERAGLPVLNDAAKRKNGK